MSKRGSTVATFRISPTQNRFDWGEETNDESRVELKVLFEGWGVRMKSMDDAGKDNSPSTYRYSSPSIREVWQLDPSSGEYRRLR
jgi:hypothetical protein